MKFKSLFFLLLFPTTLLAQKRQKPEFDLEALIDRLVPTQEEELDYESIYEVLFQLFQEPLDLNKADPEELQASYLFSPNQLSNFLDYRANYGPFISIYELQAIPEFDQMLIENLQPFVTIQDQSAKPKNFWQRLAEEENAYFLLRHRRTWEKRNICSVSPSVFICTK
jgi:hypothetical protein